MTGTHVAMNRDYWNGMAADWVDGGRRLWGLDTPQWGIWAVPEREVGMLPADMAGMTAVELGCGTGYVAGWMARRSATVTGIDVSSAQLDTARALASEHGADLTLIEGNAEATGLPTGAFDFAISEYGAAIWCDPELWLPEAYRLLKPGGQLVFLGTHPLALLCTPLSGAACDTTLHRPLRGLGRLDWSKVEIDPGGVEFNRSMSDWMALFARIGFIVDGYHELYAPADETKDQYHITAKFARDFPSEQVWKLRKPV